MIPGHYHHSQIQTGDTIMSCPVTGREYHVTKWAELHDGRTRALEKKPLDDVQPASD